MYHDQRRPHLERVSPPIGEQEQEQEQDEDSGDADAEHG